MYTQIIFQNGKYDQYSIHKNKLDQVIFKVNKPSHAVVLQICPCKEVCVNGGRELTKTELMY